MSVLTFRALRRRALCGSAIAAALGFAAAAGRANPASGGRRHGAEGATENRTEARTGACGSTSSACAARRQRQPAPAAPPVNPVAATTNTLNQGLNTIYAPIGTISTTISHDTIQALPGGDNQTVEKILLQAPGVTQDSPPAAAFTSATSTPMCKSASTASCCRTALPASARFSTPR